MEDKLAQTEGSLPTVCLQNAKRWVIWCILLL